MATDEMTPGRCNAKTGNGYCEAYPTKDDDGEIVNGRCRHHGGVVADNPGPPEGNQCATKHGLYADPGNLYDSLEDDEQARVDAMADALADRVVDVRGRLDPFDRFMCERVAIRLYQQRIAEDWLAEQGEATGNPLVERTHVSGDSGAVEVDIPNRIIRSMNDLSREARQWLKDAGLLDDPESQKAEAAGDAVEAWRRVIESNRSDE